MSNNELTLCETGSCSSQNGAAVISGTSRRLRTLGDRSGAGRHPATGPAPAQAQTGVAMNAPELPRITDKRIKWTKEARKELWICYILSGAPERGFRKRMMQIWQERGNNASFTEQKLASQINEIEKKGLLNQQDKDEALTTANNTRDPSEHATGGDNQVAQIERDIQPVEIMEQGDREVDIAEEGVQPARVETNPELEIDPNPGTITIETDEQPPQEMRTLVMEIATTFEENKSKSELEPILAAKSQNQGKLKQITLDVNAALKYIPTNNISETNLLIYTAATMINKKMEMKETKNKNRRFKDPPWKHRVEKKIKLLRKHLSWLLEMKSNNLRNEQKLNELEKSYKVKENGTKAVEKTQRQRIKSNSNKIKRFVDRVNFYQQNKLFNSNQRRLFSNLRGNEKEQRVPDAESSRNFWAGIWSEGVEFNKNATWLDEIRENHQEKSPDLKLTSQKLRKQLSKTANWKAPGPDYIHGYWIKNLTETHLRIVKQLQNCIDAQCIPLWMTRGKTVLIQKDKNKGTIASNYRPITCLPIMWKIMTGICADYMYEHLEACGALPDEQKGCKRNVMGTKDHLLLDKFIMKLVKQKKKDICMAWVDYKKAFDMVPHDWIIECMNIYGCPNNITQMLKGSMENWRVNLTANSKNLGEVKISRGIFQGDSLSPLLFVMALIPLSNLLRKTAGGFNLNRSIRLNHLLFMDDLKLYGKNEAETTSLLNKVKEFSADIGMKFGLEKCGMLKIEKGNVKKIEGIDLAENVRINEIEEEGYRYLGILEYDNIKHNEMKYQVKGEYLKRVKLILKSQLNGGNTIAAINTWAVPVLRYAAGIIDWTQLEIRKIDTKTRKLLTIYRALHPRDCVARLYLKRKTGGRGLISAEDCINTECCSLGQYLKNSTNRIIKLVWTSNIIKRNEDPDQYRGRIKQQRQEEWRTMQMSGQYLRQVEDKQDQNSWNWLKRGELKRETEGLILAAQSQAIRTRVTSAIIDGRNINTNCRMCSNKPETINHIINECPKLAQGEYKKRHDKVARAVHWSLSKRAGLPYQEKWYNHEPNTVEENEDYKLLWDMAIQTDRVISARRPDIVIIDKKEKTTTLIDIAVPYDTRIEEKEIEKITKYQDLKIEIQRCWQTKTTVVPIVVGALGAMPKGLTENLKKLGCENLHPGLIQKSVLLGTAHILRKVLGI